MDTENLPDDLAALERGLASRPRPAPTEDLRRRVMAGVRGEWVAGAPPARRRLSRWEFALATAAAVLVWMNLSMSAASDTHWNLQSSAGPDPEAVAALRALVPELSDREARRQAILLGAGARLARVPKLGVPPLGEWIGRWSRPPTPVDLPHDEPIRRKTWVTP